MSQDEIEKVVSRLEKKIAKLEADLKKRDALREFGEIQAEKRGRIKGMREAEEWLTKQGYTLLAERWGYLTNAAENHRQ